MALRTAGSIAGRTVVMTGVYAALGETGMEPKPRRRSRAAHLLQGRPQTRGMEVLAAILLLVTKSYLERRPRA
jgi:hypothetical protein